MDRSVLRVDQIFFGVAQLFLDVGQFSFNVDLDLFRVSHVFLSFLACVNLYKKPVGGRSNLR